MGTMKKKSKKGQGRELCFTFPYCLGKLTVFAEVVSLIVLARIYKRGCNP